MRTRNTKPDPEPMADRLREARQAAGYKNARKAAVSFGWPYPTYAGHENASRRFKRRDAEIYAAAFKTDPDYLLTGKVNTKSPNNGETSWNFHGITSVPRHDLNTLATFEDIMNNKTPISSIGRSEPLPGGVKAGPRAFAITIEDEAMTGGKVPLNPGVIGYFDPDAECRTGDIVIATVAGYPSAVVRKLRVSVGKDQTPEINLAAQDDDFSSFSSAAHTINLVGKLVGVWLAV